MKHYLFCICIMLIASCTTTPDVTPDASESLAEWTAPVPITPLDESYFVDSDMLLEWDWPPLMETQRFAVRVQYDDEPHQEVWTVDNTLSAQDMIDTYSRDVGEFSWQVAVINTNDAGSFDSMGSEWSTPQTLQRVRRMPLDPLPREQWSDATQIVYDLSDGTPSSIIDTLRNFVHTNTNIKSPLSYKPDYSDALELMVSYYNGGEAQPELYCDGLSTAMMTVLNELGIESRLIFLYGHIPGWITQHTFLEIFNPDTQAWEVSDASFHLYYKDTETGQRASVERLVFGSLDTIVACDADDNCSKEQVEPYKDYFHAFRYGHSDTFWVNPDRFDVTTRFEAFDGANLAEFLTGNPRDFVFRFDNWEAPSN